MKKIIITIFVAFFLSNGITCIAAANPVGLPNVTDECSQMIFLKEELDICRISPEYAKSLGAIVREPAVDTCNTHQNELNIAENNISSLRNQINSLQDDIQNSNQDTNSYKIQLNKANETIKTLQAGILSQNQTISNLENKLNESNSRIVIKEISVPKVETPKEIKTVIPPTEIGSSVVITEQKPTEIPQKQSFLKRFIIWINNININHGKTN